MKPFFFTFLLCISLLQISYSQNTFPSSGNVGIGTTSPQQLLNINSVASPTVSQFKITGNGLGSLSALNWIPDNISIGFDVDFTSSQWIARNSSVAWLYKTAGLFQIMGSGGNTVGGGATQNPLFAINLTSGNVSIGTTSPNAGNKLEVNGSIATYPTGGFWLNAPRSAGIADEGNAGAGDGSIYFRAGNADGRMVINSLGNVLIGKTSQTNTGYILDVAGNVRANQIVVNTTGADFVFEPSYPLHSLSFLKKYIDQNHHLPEIPSAKQMQAEGLNVSDNQVKLLQKVEELTLYLIELKKENETLKQNQKVINAKLKRHHIN
jgi:hypothetical protein